MDQPATSNYERLDLANLGENGVPKDELAKRRQEQRDKRRAVRKAKRAEKAEAKESRKANVSRAGKWQGERKETDRLKKAANKPIKAEKRRKHNEKRASLLTEQNADIQVRAAKAAERAEAAAKYKAGEDAVMQELLRERRAKSKKETDDFIPLDNMDSNIALASKLDKKLGKGGDGVDFDSGSDSDSASSDDSDSSSSDRDEQDGFSDSPKEAAKLSKTKSEKEQSKAAEVTTEESALPKEAPSGKKNKKSKKSETKVLTDEADGATSKKRKHKSSKEDAKADLNVQDTKPAPSADKPGKKDKKRRRDFEGTEAHTSEEVGKSAKKEKKQKRSTEVADEHKAEEKSSKKSKQDKKRGGESEPAAAPADVETEEQEPEAESAKKSSKKSKKDKKRKQDSEAVDETAVGKDESSARKMKKDKKSKKAKAVEGPEDSGPAVEDKATVAAAEAEQWNVKELEGGESRQAKFLRLLGGKKGGAPAATTGSASSSRPHLDINKASKELEQQFEAGRRMKFDMGGQRKGLGA